MRSRWALETCPRNHSTSRPNDSSRWQRRRIPISANWVKIKCPVASVDHFLEHFAESRHFARSPADG